MNEGETFEWYSDRIIALTKDNTKLYEKLETLQKKLKEKEKEKEEYVELDTLLVGKTIEALFMSDDKVFLLLFTESEVIPINAYGDCCSNSWVEHISGFENLIGSEIKKVENTSLERIENAEFDVLQKYSFKITTSKGVCELEYRNESNGYYGGDLKYYTGYDIKFSPMDCLNIKRVLGDF